MWNIMNITLAIDIASCAESYAKSDSYKQRLWSASAWSILNFIPSQPESDRLNFINSSKLALFPTCARNYHGSLRWLRES